MKTEYILYLTVPIILIAFLGVLYIAGTHLKKKIVLAKMNSFIKDPHLKKPVEVTHKRVAYMKRNKKYIPISEYNKNMRIIENY